MKQIAVILGAINLDNQKKLLKGMEISAKEYDCNLYVFTNYIGTRETEESIMASSQVLKLLDYDYFDGIVVAPNTVHNHLALKKLLQELSEVKIPVVSIDRKLDGMSCIAVDSYEAEYEMVEHFISHGYTNIAYVSGRMIL